MSRLNDHPQRITIPKIDEVYIEAISLMKLMSTGINRAIEFLDEVRDEKEYYNGSRDVPRQLAHPQQERVTYEAERVITAPVAKYLPASGCVVAYQLHKSGQWFTGNVAREMENDNITPTGNFRVNCSSYSVKSGNILKYIVLEEADF